MNILVTGAAGYIGSFMVKLLLEHSHNVIALDSLERGHKGAVDVQTNLVVGNLLDQSFLGNVFSRNQIDSVIHFAGYISMGESMQNPSLYFTNNTIASMRLLDEMVKHDVHKIIFSSTAGIYGNPVTVPIPETHVKNPENPYGESKLMVERMLSWYQNIHKIQFVALRYFNAAGAALDGSLGELHTPESHIIPKAIEAAINQQPFSLYGSDYNTPDGTCVRDYIHVLDLTNAHLLAMQKMEKEPGGYFFNVGTGKGYSNKEVLQMVEQVSGKKITIEEKPRRPGDADTLVADVSKITQEFSFAPRHSELKEIVSTAWRWHSNNTK